MENQRRPGNYRHINESYRQSRDVEIRPADPRPEIVPEPVARPPQVPKKQSEAGLPPQ